MERMKSLGVVTAKEIPSKEKVAELFVSLEDILEQEDVTIADFVKIIKEYLPNFGQIETGKSLDIKM